MSATTVTAMPMLKPTMPHVVPSVKPSTHLSTPKIGGLTSVFKR